MTVLSPLTPALPGRVRSLTLDDIEPRPAPFLNVSSRAFVLACTELGVPRHALLRAAGIDGALLEAPDGRLHSHQVQALWEAAFVMTAEPDLALRAAEALPFGAYRVIDYLVANAPTVGDGLVKLCDCFPIVNTGAELVLTHVDSMVGFELRPRPDFTATRAFAEYSLAACFLRTRRATGVDFPLAAVELAFDAPPSISTHRRVFDCDDVRFGAPVSRWLMTEDAFGLATQQANPHLYAILDEHAGLVRGRLPTEAGLASRLRDAIRHTLPGGGTTLSAVASRLGVGERTLQRRLRDEDVSFKALVEETRHALARVYLGADGVSIGEAAYLLGFSQPAAFHRAFKRWTGQTPGEFRAGQR